MTMRVFARAGAWSVVSGSRRPDGPERVVIVGGPRALEGQCETRLYRKERSR